MFLRHASFLLTLLLLSVTTSFAADTTAETKAARPNILWITCEDISPNLGCYGDTFAITPNLDKFAKRSIRYTNAHGVTGVCAVNRSCIITGMYPTSIGSQDMRQNTWLPTSPVAIRAFSAYLREAGYYCTNPGKTDYNFPVPKDAWDKGRDWSGRKEGQPFFHVVNFTVTHESQYRTSPQRHANNTKRLTDVQRVDRSKVPVPPIHPECPEVRENWAKYRECITAMDYQVGDVLKKLEADGLADDTIVFFYSDHGVGMPSCKKWVWTSGTHVPFLVHVPKRFQHLLPEKEAGKSVSDRLVSFVDLAPTVLALAGVEIPKHLQGVPFLGEPAKKMPERDFLYGSRDRMAERYDTVRFIRNKDNLFIVNFRPDLPSSQFVSYTEQMPTMQVWRKMHYLNQLTPAQEKYFSQSKPVFELYDTKKDPWCLDNLAKVNPETNRNMRPMLQALFQWICESGDTGLLPEDILFSRAIQGKVAPYDIGRKLLQDQPMGIKPGAAVSSAGSIFTAFLSAIPFYPGEPKAATPADFFAAAKTAESSEKRWWHLQATLNSLLATRSNPFPVVNPPDGRTDKKAEEKFLRELLAIAKSDPTPVVRIKAAEILARRFGRFDEVQDVFKTGLASKSPQVRLRTLNVLDRLDLNALPLLKEIAAAKFPNPRNEKFSHTASYVNRLADYLPAKLKQELPPLWDLHIHLRGGVTPESTAALAKRTGMRCGVLKNLGEGWSVETDEQLAALLDEVKGKEGKDGQRKQPKALAEANILLGLQVNDRDWYKAHPKKLLDQVDYILADTMIVPDKEGNLIRLWHKDKVKVDDPEKWMDRYIKHNLVVLSEPVDVLANATYLPACLMDQYDKLWTKERMQKVIDAAVKNNVAIEINFSSGLPHYPFLKLAKEAGCKFTFGTNNHDPRHFDTDRAFFVARELGLTASDVFDPTEK